MPVRAMVGLTYVAMIAVNALAAEARSHYERALQAQRAGDWATYGEEIRQLGETLQRMSR